MIIAKGVWSDEQSQSSWDGLYHSPYQLWEADPASGAELRLQDVTFSCPWCPKSQTQVSNLKSSTKTALSVCPEYGWKFSANALSAQYLQGDMREFITIQDGW